MGGIVFGSVGSELGSVMALHILHAAAKLGNGKLHKRPFNDLIYLLRSKLRVLSSKDCTDSAAPLTKTQTLPAVVVGTVVVGAAVVGATVVGATVVGATVIGRVVVAPTFEVRMHE